MHSCARGGMWLLRSTFCHLRHLQGVLQRRHASLSTLCCSQSSATDSCRSRSKWAVRKLIPLTLLVCASKCCRRHRYPPAHCNIHQHQRAAGFQLRFVRRAGRPSCQRASHPRAPGQHAGRSSFPSCQMGRVAHTRLSATHVNLLP